MVQVGNRTTEPAGFTLARVVELPPFHYGAVFRVVEAAKVGNEL